VAQLEGFLIAGHANLQFNPWQSQVDIGYQTTSTMKIILSRRIRKIIIEAINETSGRWKEVWKDMVRCVTINCKGNQNHSS